MIEEAGFCHDLLTAPVELRSEEIADIGFTGRTEAVGYGRMMLMLSEHCLIKTTGRCTKENSSLRFSDEKGNEYLVYPDCRYCNNVIYDHHPVSLIKDILGSTEIKRIRIDLTDETRDETHKLIACLSSGRYTDQGNAYTAGFYTGVL